MINKIVAPLGFGLKYKNSLIPTKRIDNFNCFREYTRKIYDSRSEEEIIKMSKIVSSKVDEFKELWGKQDFMFRYEYNNYAWLVECDGCKAIIFSAKGKGTSVEILLNENGKPLGSVQNFFDEYIKLMLSFN